MRYEIMRVLLAASILPLLYTAPASAGRGGDAYDNVETKAGSNVVSVGGCVRTKWMAENDPCAPPPPKEEVKVAPPPPPPAPKIALEHRTVYFDFNKTTLTPEAVGKLDNLVSIILSSKGIQRATVLGYADAIGSDDYNVALSEKRAGAVQQYLASRVSIPTHVLLVAGKGETGSVTSCDEKMKRSERIICLAQDRRVEVEFNYVQ